MEIFAANKQWSVRPADERFESLTDMYLATKHYADTAAEKRIPVNTLRAEAREGDIVVVGKQNIPSRFTNWSFSQICARVGAPAGYLRDLPATLAAQNLNHGLARCEDSQNSKLLFHQNGSLLLRAITGEGYARIWNHEIVAKLRGLESQGWTPARPDKRFDGGDPKQCQMCNGKGTVYLGKASGASDSCMYCKGTGRAFPALYASDHDMFAFVKNASITVREPGNPDGLQRGVIVSNSEVGAASLKLTRFLYREMCGNHIIWGAKNATEIKVRHVGNAISRWRGYEAEIRRYANEGAQEDEARIARSKTVFIGDTKEQVLDKLFGMRSLGLTQKTLEAGYAAAVPAQDGDPRTVWGMVQGLTRHSQQTTHADTRMGIDTAAGKIMEANF